MITGGGAAIGGFLWWQPSTDQIWQLLAMVVAMAWIAFRIRDVREAKRRPPDQVVLHVHRRAGWW